MTPLVPIRRVQGSRTLVHPVRTLVHPVRTRSGGRDKGATRARQGRDTGRSFP